MYLLEKPPVCRSVYFYLELQKPTGLGKEQLSVWSSISVTHATTSNYTGTKKKPRHIKRR